MIVTVGDLRDGFNVEDHGPGIPEPDRTEVFESGYSTKDDGTGFGLSIVAEIADANDWAVTPTESEDGARGSSSPVSDRRSEERPQGVP